MSLDSHTQSPKLQFCSYQSASRDSVSTAIPPHNTSGLTDGSTIFKAEHGCIFLSFAKQVHEMCHMAGSMQMTKQSEFSRNTRWGCQKDSNNFLSKKKSPNYTDRCSTKSFVTSLLSRGENFHYLCHLKSSWMKENHI